MSRSIEELRRLAGEKVAAIKASEPERFTPVETVDAHKYHVRVVGRTKADDDYRIGRDVRNMFKPLSRI